MALGFATSADSITLHKMNLLLHVFGGFVTQHCLHLTVGKLASKAQSWRKTLILPTVNKWQQLGAGLPVPKQSLFLPLHFCFFFSVDKGQSPLCSAAQGLCFVLR